MTRSMQAEHSLDAMPITMMIVIEDVVTASMHKCMMERRKYGGRSGPPHVDRVKTAPCLW